MWIFDRSGVNVNDCKATPLFNMISGWFTKLSQSSKAAASEATTSTFGRNDCAPDGCCCTCTRRFTKRCKSTIVCAVPSTCRSGLSCRTIEAFPLAVPQNNNLQSNTREPQPPDACSNCQQSRASGKSQRAMVQTLGRGPACTCAAGAGPARCPGGPRPPARRAAWPPPRQTPHAPAPRRCRRRRRPAAAAAPPLAAASPSPAIRRLRRVTRCDGSGSVDSAECATCAPLFW